MTVQKPIFLPYSMLGFTVYHYDSVSSTAQIAKSDTFQKIGREKPIVILSNMQTSGRGRLGNTWCSLEGNMLANIVLPFGEDIERRSHMSFIIALALFDVIEEMIKNADKIGHSVHIKWPNDILVDGAKIAGVLLESLPHTLSIGVGINIQQSPDIQKYPTTHIKRMGIKTDVSHVLKSLLEKLKFWLCIWQENGLYPVIFQWKSRLKGIGTRITIRRYAEEYMGILCDISDTGTLYLKTDSGIIESFNSGEVIFE